MRQMVLEIFHFRESQEFGQDGHRHFVGFQPHFHLNMTSQTQCCKTMKKWKCNISAVCCLICLKLCKLLEFSKGIWLDFKFRCYGNQNQSYCLLLKKQKVQLLKQNWCSNSNLKQYSLIVTAGSVKFWRKTGDTLFLLWENNSLLFLKKSQLFSFELPWQRNLKSSEIPLFTSKSLQNCKQIRDSWDIPLSFCQCLAGLRLWRHISVKTRLKIYKMAASILLKFLTLKWDISRTIWRIKVSDGLFFCIFHALSFQLNFFSTGVSL